MEPPYPVITSRCHGDQSTREVCPGRSDEMLQDMSDDNSHENAQVPAENVLSARPSSAEVPLEHEKEPKMLIAALHQKGGRRPMIVRFIREKR